MSEAEPIGLLVAIVRRRIKQVTTALVREHGLSPQQFWTVMMIARNRGMSLREVAARRGMDQPTACRVVDVLVRRRLVRSDADPRDRRRSRLALTAAGSEMIEALLPVANAISATVERGLTASERRAIVAGLRKMIANLDALDAVARPHGARARAAGR